MKDIPVSDTLTGERLLLDSIIANGRGISLSVTILIQSIGSLRPSDFMNFINAKRHELFPHPIKNITKPHPFGYPHCHRTNRYCGGRPGR